MNVRCVTTADAWEKLRPQWNLILQRSEANSIFLTWEWLQAWWSVYGHNRQLYILAALEGSEVVGIAPLYLERERHCGRNWQVVRFIGHGSNDSDYLSFIVSAGREEEVIGEFVEYLAKQTPRWDVADLEGPVEGSRVLAAWRHRAARRHWDVYQDSIPGAMLPLPQRWEDYLQSLKPRFRTKVRTALGFFENTLHSSPRVCSSEDELGPWLDILFDLHTRRWQRNGQPGVFRDADKRRFYAEISRLALNNGWLAFHRLDWCDRPLALQYGFAYNKRFYLLQEGYDPEFEDVRPGLSLRAALIRHWIEAGMREYDFLAGASRYKLEWGGQPKVSIRILVAANRSSRLAYLSVPRSIQIAKEHIRTAVPEPLLEWRKRVLQDRDRRRWRAPNATQHSSKVQSMAALYSLAPVRAAGRAIASQYHLVRGKQGISLVTRTRPACQIMMFHRVNDDKDVFLPATPVSVFRQQMSYISKNFRIVSLDDVVNGAAFQATVAGGKFSVAVTLDDGYRDNFLHAFPILKELGIPATIFLATGYLDSSELPWYDKVCLAFKLSVADSLTLEGGGPAGFMAERLARLALLSRTISWLRELSEEDRVEALSQLYRGLRVSPRALALPRPMLSWDEVRQMSKHGVIFGGHTISHPVVSKLSRTHLEQEIGGGKRRIENQLQQPVCHFAYPFGSPADIGALAPQIVREQGFSTAVTTVWGLNDLSVDQYQLRRCNPWENDPNVFALKFDWNRFCAATSGAADPGLQQDVGNDGSASVRLRKDETVGKMEGA